MTTIYSGLKWGFTWLPHKSYGRWNWLFYRYHSITIKRTTDAS